MRTQLLLAALVTLPLALTSGQVAASQSPAPASARAANPVDGPLLGGSDFLSLAGRARPHGLALRCYAELSSDGSMIATVRYSTASPCDGTQTLVVLRPGRPPLKLAAFTSDIVGLTWAPNGSALAVRVTDDNDNDVIYRVPIDGSPRSVILDAEAADFSLQGGSISWGANDRIAFVGNPNSVYENSGFVSYSDQLYTVSSAGGAPTAWNHPYVDAACGAGPPFPACTYRHFREPQWSPDGSRLAANVITATLPSGGGEGTRSLAVGTLALGQEDPTVLRHVSSGTSFYPLRFLINSSQRPMWSVAGTSVLVSTLNESLSARENRLVRVSDKSAQLLGYTGSYYDWQACPSGTCVAWPVPAEPKVSLRVQRRPKIKVTGTVTPRQSGKATVVLQARARQKWMSVAKKTVAVTTGRFNTQFAQKPKAKQCRVIATFRGVSLAKTFRC